MRCFILALVFLSGTAMARPATEWDKKLVSVANKEGIPAPLLAAICYTESTHKPYATNLDDNGSSSIGLCQVKYSTVKALGYTGKVEGLYDGRTNAKWAAKYIKTQMVRYNNSWDDAIAAYNAGTAKKCDMKKKYFVVTAHRKDGTAYKKKKSCVENEYLNQTYINDVMSNLLP